MARIAGDRRGHVPNLLLNSVRVPGIPLGTCPRNSETQLGAGYIADFVLTIIYSMVDSVYIFVYYIVDFMTIPSFLWLNLWQSFYEVH